MRCTVQAMKDYEGEALLCELSAEVATGQGKMMRLLILVCMLAASVMLSQGARADAEDIKACSEESQDCLQIVGSTTVTANLIYPHQKALEKAVGQGLYVRPIGSGAGMRALVSGEGDLGMVSAPLEELAGKLPDTDLSGLQEHFLGYGEVAFIASPRLGIRELTNEEARRILLGEIDNWQDVGGPDLNVIVIMEPSDGGVHSTVRDRLLNGQDVRDDAIIVAQGFLVARAVSVRVNAMGVISRPTITEQMRVIKLDKPVRQGLYFVTRGEPDKTAKRLIDKARDLLSEDTEDASEG